MLAGQVAGLLSSQPGPPDIGLYPLVNTSMDNELIIEPSFNQTGRSLNAIIAASHQGVPGSDYRPYRGGMAGRVG
ncbi:hypothetical protein Vau01_019190 [Virgisporangium aurantiacum]|uniref:Uncharacterized protein n=1 Tax=Virgisporangium aurantiacum TaxID=175570 RepID=A0A8J4DYF8_9ACTN|nr:hypothetical protein Vau01_019190 [Virgisporangium aurantiacum]